MENLTKETFKEKIFNAETSPDIWCFKGTKPAIIDFYADWCGPCKVVAPILEELSREYPAIDFYKIDTEEQSELAAMFQIRSIPVILLIPMKGLPKRIVGAMPKNILKEYIKDNLGIE